VIDQVLSSPTKIKILIVLWKFGEMNITELVRRVGASHRATVQQLRQLIEHGVVEARQIGRMRLYRLPNDEAVQKLAEALARADEWLASSKAQRLA